ncbi:hypothetical protein NDU88_011250 [Pleurodeles waltl]|uniref:Uncharacterized protein n=1 Tax=Pleurodeles waltl TaxID=8319 RepID=A0AAV7Q173_PLEWA|nr:hypothetical protein NDU88_011250 [Pleurodeles waltl]
MCLTSAAVPSTIPSGGPGSGARSEKTSVLSAAAARTESDGEPGSSAGGCQRPHPLRSVRSRPSRHRRIQVGHSSDGLSTRGAPCCVHTARGLDPAPPRGEDKRGQGPGGLAHSGSQRSPPNQGPWSRPLHRWHRSRRSCMVGVIFPRCLQRPYMCRGLLLLRALVSGITGIRITADFGGPRAELLVEASAPVAILATPP